MYLYQYDTLGNLVGSEKHASGSPVAITPLVVTSMYPEIN